MNTLKKLITDHAAAYEALRAAVASEPLDVVALSEVERRIDRLEANTIEYRPRSPRALLTKLSFLREQVMVKCEESSTVGAMLAAIAIDVREMLASTAKHHRSIVTQGESHL